MKVERVRRWEGPEEAGEEGGMPPSSPARASRGLRPVPEPEVKAQRRQFSGTYKLHLLHEADACKNPGEIAALLRREGLYASHLSKWRKHHRLGTLEGMRGRKADSDAELKQRIGNSSGRTSGSRPSCTKQPRLSTSKKKSRSFLVSAWTRPTPATRSVDSAGR